MLHGRITSYNVCYTKLLRNDGKPIDMADILQDYLQQFPEYQHFDVARMLVDQAVRLGYSADEISGLSHPKWKPINNLGAKVQAHVIDKY